MSIYFDGANDNANYTGSLGTATGAPITIMAWVYRLDLTAALDGLVSYGDGGGSDNHSILLRTSSTGAASVMTRDGVTNPSATTTQTALESAWHHYAAVVPSNSSRTAYLDGNASTTNTTALGTVNAFDEFIVGDNFTSAVDFKGYIGHVAVWKSALSGAQISSLAAGADPQTIDSSNLVAYYPMTSSGSPGTDVVGGYNLTLNGNAAYNANNPSVGASTKRIVPVNFIRSQSATASGN